MLFLINKNVFLISAILYPNGLYVKYMSSVCISPAPQRPLGRHHLICRYHVNANQKINKLTDWNRGLSGHCFLLQDIINILNGTQTKDTSTFGDTSGFEDFVVMSSLEADESESGGIIEVSGFVIRRTGTGGGNDEVMSVKEDLELFDVGISGIGI